MVEQADTWKQYKYLRNKINNTKSSKEHRFKLQKVSTVLDCAGKKTWKTAKEFMGWKQQGSPNPLEITNVQKIREGIAIVINCDQIIRSKAFKLSMKRCHSQ